MATAKREIWKVPPSLGQARIEVSDLGRVRTKPYLRSYRRQNGVSRVERRKGRVLKIQQDPRGRWILIGSAINKGLIGKSYLVHRLVAECFVENNNPQRNRFVLFKNGDKSDSRAENLFWGDWRDAISLGERKQVELVIDLFMDRARKNKMGTFYGIGEVGRSVGCSKQAVHKAMKENRAVKGFYPVLAKRIQKGKAPQKTIQDVMKERFEMPKECFAEENIDITPKAIFG